MAAPLGSVVSCSRREPLDGWVSSSWLMKYIDGGSVKTCWNRARRWSLESFLSFSSTISERVRIGKPHLSISSSQVDRAIATGAITKMWPIGRTDCNTESVVRVLPRPTPSHAPP